MLASSDALNSAYSLLGSTVREFYATGRRLLAARLKPELRRRSNLTFNETSLGYLTFSDFLRSAEAAGIVQLTSSPAGHMEILPADIQAARSALATSTPTPRFVAVSNTASSHPSGPMPSTARVRVREDLWKAFNSTSGTWVFDPSRDFAYRLGALSTPTPEGSAQTIQIPPNRDRTANWIRAFANIQEPALREKLLGAAGQEPDIYHFTTAIAGSAKLLRSWRHFHIQQVLAAINAWAESNGVHPKEVARVYAPLPSVNFRHPAAFPVVGPPAVPSRTASARADTSAAADSASSPTHSSMLMPKVSIMIDELIDQLLRLRGALQVIESK